METKIEGMKTMGMLKTGILIYMYGNGPKPPLEEIKGQLQKSIEIIKSVDKSKIKNEGNFNLVPREYVKTANQSNQSIEKFIGYAKRKDTTKEEVKELHELLKEVVKVDCEVMGSSTTRLKYVEDLKELIEDKYAKVPVLIREEELIKNFGIWFKHCMDMIRLSDIHVTPISILEGKDEVIEKYKEEDDRKCEEYTSEILSKEGIKSEDFNAFKHIEIIGKIYEKSQEFEKEQKMKYLEEVTKKVKDLKVHPRRVRITALGKVLEQLTMSEIIEEAEKYWGPLYMEDKFELGKAVVLFPCMEFNEVSYVVATHDPMPVVAEFSKGWRKAYKEFKGLLEEQGFYVIETNDNGHRKVDPQKEKEIMQEVNKYMRKNRYN